LDLACGTGHTWWPFPDAPASMCLAALLFLCSVTYFSEGLSFTGRRVDPVPLASDFNRTLLKCYDSIPRLTPDNVMDILDSYDMSYFRRQRLELMTSELKMSYDAAKVSYASMTQRCELDFVQPPGCKVGNAVALVFSGQTRSFLNPQVLQYWGNVTAAITGSGWKPSVFAVFDEVSFSSSVKGKGVVAHNDSVEVLSRVLTSLDSDAAFVFLHGDATLKGHRQYVLNSRLRTILTPQNEDELKTVGGGAECAYMKLIVGLDLILQREAQQNICFTHVFRVRPDYMWLNLQNPAFLSSVWTNLTDSVYMINDVAAMMPRKLASAYFTSFIMHRAMKNVTQKTTADLLDTFVRNGRPGSLMQPSTWVAYTGSLIAGHGLEIDTYKGVALAGEIEYAGLERGDNNGFIVREDMEVGDCLGNESRLVRHNFVLPLCDAY